MPPPQHSARSPPPLPDALPTTDGAGGVCPAGRDAFSGGSAIARVFRTWK